MDDSKVLSKCADNDQFRMYGESCGALKFLCNMTAFKEEVQSNCKRTCEVCHKRHHMRVLARLNQSSLIQRRHAQAKSMEGVQKVCKLYGLALQGVGVAKNCFSPGGSCASSAVNFAFQAAGC